MKHLDKDIIIVGAGFAGLYMLHCARKLGLAPVLFETAGGVGGTWYWNRYPGARCDVPSMEYSYQFDEQLQQEWQWSELYPAQAEILSYLEHVAERFSLLDDIRFNTRVVSAIFDEDGKAWRVRTDDGKSWTSRFCVFATGCLSSANKPEFENQQAFSGPVYHTGDWPREKTDFKGRTVAVIGTGSSAIQAIPEIAGQAKRLFVFQRTASYSVPAYNRPLPAEEQDKIKASYSELRARAAEQFSGNDFHSNPLAASEMSDREIQEECDRRWQMGGLYWYGAFADLLIDKKTNDRVADYVRGKIAERVGDAAVAGKLLPDTIFGCKRLCVDTHYFETFRLPHVQLVDIRNTPIEALTPHGLRVGGKEYPVDIIVMATGFDAMTGALDRIAIRGRDGLALKDKWQNGPLSYLGVQSSGFPNMFIITGPGSPSVLTNMVPSIEQNVEYVRDMLRFMQARQYTLVEASEDAEREWTAHCNEVADSTLLPHCNSWYLGANIPGKPRTFMPYLGFPAYREKCEAVAADDYAGFLMQV